MNPVPTCYSDTLTILFTGDILLDRGVRYYLEHGGMRRIIPDETADFLRSADVVVGNLECPATTVQAPAFKRYVFRGDPQWLDSLRAYGFTHLNLANNHSVDQGRQGLRDTRLNILKAGLIPIGVDSTMQAAATAITLMKTLPPETLPPAPPCMEGSTLPAEILSADKGILLPSIQGGAGGRVSWGPFISSPPTVFPWRALLTCPTVRASAKSHLTRCSTE